MHYLIDLVFTVTSLLGGNSSFEGNVQVYSNGTWQAVCDDAWDINDANVVCNQIGFTNATHYYRNSYFGRVNSSFSMFDVQCNGNESRIQDCPHNISTSTSCGQNNIAGVECKLLLVYMTMYME